MKVGVYVFISVRVCIGNRMQQFDRKSLRIVRLLLV